MQQLQQPEQNLRPLSCIYRAYLLATFCFDIHCKVFLGQFLTRVVLAWSTKVITMCLSWALVLGHRFNCVIKFNWCPLLTNVRWKNSCLFYGWNIFSQFSKIDPFLFLRRLLRTDQTNQLIPSNEELGQLGDTQVLAEQDCDGSESRETHTVKKISVDEERKGKMKRKRGSKEKFYKGNVEREILILLFNFDSEAKM